MNYTELLIDTLDYSEGSNDLEDTILQFKVRLVGTGVDAFCGLNLSKIDKILTNWDNRDLTWENVMEVGHLLGNALFQDPIRQVLLQRMPKPGSDDGLRIRLFLQYPLTNYPFEYLLINDTGGETTANHFLALRPNLSIVRHQNNQAPPSMLSPGTYPVKMVVALASPTTFPPVLDLSKERTAIAEAVDNYPERVKAVFCEPAILTNLEAALKEAPIFHYAGHAAMAKKASKIFGLLEGKGKLILDDDDGDGLPDPMDIEQLSALLKTANTRLAVLGGCETARRDDLNIWSSLAAHLLNAGLFAVIGMQYKIGNKSATAFTGEFYNALLAGLSIDQAVTNGRMAVAALGNVRDWAVPVLYLAGMTDGIVFKEFKDDPALEPVRQKIITKATQILGELTGKLTGIKAKNIAWGKVEVYEKIEHVAKGATAIAVEAETVQPGAEVNTTQIIDNLEGEVIGQKYNTIGSSSAKSSNTTGGLTCSNCGTTNRPGDKFCKKCGKPLLNTP